VRQAHDRKRKEFALKTAYFNCIGGASGDMVLGAIVDAGLPLADLERELKRVGIDGFSLSDRRAQRGGVSGTLVEVDVEEKAQRGMHWSDFASIIDSSTLETAAAESARAVLRRLAEAEAVAHGTTVGDSELHELGNLDTIVDVVGSVVGLELLGVERVYSSPFPSGSGTVQSEHGLLPVPAPATAALFGMAGAPLVPAPNNATETGEMVTPTGAAILTTLATFRQPSLTLDRVGYGLGSKESPQYPNVLALWLGDESGAAYTTDNTMIETNIDDMAADMLGYLHERLFEIGARDVWFTPVQMKKNRPGTMISAIVPSDLELRAIELIMRESSTLGVRVRPLSRYEAGREITEVDTSLGTVAVKLKKLNGRNVAVAPEYESCRRIALDKDLPLQDVYRLTQREAEEALLDQ